MTVTMTIEEFDELREAKRTLDLVKKCLYENVCYTVEADSCPCSQAWFYVKALDPDVVQRLLHIVGVCPNYENVDRLEEDKV